MSSLTGWDDWMIVLWAALLPFALVVAIAAAIIDRIKHK